MTPELERALGELYRGQTNVATKAKELNIPLKELQQTLIEYINRTPIDPTAWSDDIELSWPYTT
jgi:hypothetical protein